MSRGDTSIGPLNVLVAGAPDPARAIAQAIETLGHGAYPSDPDPQTAARAATDADVVVVVSEGNEDSALRLIAMLSHEAAFPVVAAMPATDCEWLEKAVVAGATGAVVGVDVEAFRISLLVAWRRFVDYRSLRDAFDRRAEIEQAKGLLMARHGINGEQAFALLRQHSQRTNRKLVEIAAALSKAHVLLTRARTHRGDEQQVASAEGAEVAPFGPQRSVI